MTGRGPGGCIREGKHVFSLAGCFLFSSGMSHLQQELMSSSSPLAPHSTAHAARQGPTPAQPQALPLPWDSAASQALPDTSTARAGLCCAHGTQGAICSNASGLPWLRWKVFYRPVALTCRL